MSEALKIMNRVVSDNGNFMCASEARFCREEIESIKKENEKLRDLLLEIGSTTNKTIQEADCIATALAIEEL